jgi:hypothetical protein
MLQLRIDWAEHRVFTHHDLVGRERNQLPPDMA